MSVHNLLHKFGFNPIDYQKSAKISASHQSNVICILILFLAIEFGVCTPSSPSFNQLTTWASVAVSFVN